jgi:hypothetical protein
MMFIRAFSYSSSVQFPAHVFLSKPKMRPFVSNSSIFMKFAPWWFKSKKLTSLNYLFSDDENLCAVDEREEVNKII